jgi:type IV pilus assembly protein PilW
MSRVMRNHSGFSIIEMMIAMTIGLLLLSGLSMIFVNSSNANRELQKTAQQIENGRYAIDVISQDLRHAGFYGHLHDTSAIAMPATIPPDPCEASTAADLLSALRFPVQGYRGLIHASNPASNTAASGLPSTCTTALLTAANLKTGSDVLVIRRADTNALAATDVATSNVFYLQASSSLGEVQVGNGAAIGSNKANGATSVLYLSNGATPPPAAPIRRLHVHIYFVAPCSKGSAANGACTGAAGEDTIPTLKRLELTSSGTITLVPLVEGIEYFKIEYGVDTGPAAGVNVNTGYVGDGTVDAYYQTPPDWTTVIAAQVYLLARNTDSTVDFTDSKTYKLGSAAASDNITVPVATGANAKYKRHVYTAAIQLVNPAGRREIP